MSRARFGGKASIFASLGLPLVTLAALQLGYSEPGLLFLAPALLLLAALVFGWYPGERLLAELARAWHPIRRRQRTPSARRLVPARFFPRGGALLAMALAGRGPPS